MTSGKEMITRWFEEVWNQGLEASIDELCSPDIVLYGAGPEPLVGLEPLRAFVKSIRSSFADVRVELHEVIESENSVACRASSSLKHPTTGAPIEMRGSTFCRIEDGRFVEAHDVWDYSALLEAVGSAPPGAMAKMLADFGS